MDSAYTPEQPGQPDSSENTMLDELGKLDYKRQSRATEGDTAEGGAAEGDTAEGDTTEGDTAEGDTAEGDTSDGSNSDSEKTPPRQPPLKRSMGCDMSKMFKKRKTQLSPIYR